MPNESATTQGKLIQAIKGGGDSALWNIARGKGSTAEKAREIIELTTSPFRDMTVFEAIEEVFKNQQG